MPSLRTLFIAAVLLPLFGYQSLAAELTAEKLTAKQLFASDHVVNVEIEIPDAEWEKLSTQARDFRSAFSNPTAKPYSYFEANVKIDGVEIKKVGLRKKGFIGSQDTERPSLKIKFDKFEEQSPVDGMETLTLNNNKQDRSLVSQFLTYQLFRDAGVHAPRSNFATVTVNGEYLGIYTHVESIKTPYLTNEFGDATGRLYEGTLSDFYPKSVERIEAKNKAAEDLTKATEFAELLAGDAPLDIDKLETLVDVDNFLKFWAIESIINFWDGYSQNQNNYFTYENPENGKFYFMPWGADSCFTDGRGFRRGPKSNIVSADSMLANRLFNTPGIPARYRATVESILDDVWDAEAMVAESERVFAMLKDEFDIHQLDAFPALDQTQAFIKGRKKIILSELKSDWPVQVSAEPRKPMYAVPMGAISGEFASNWNETTEAKDASEFTFKDEVIKSRSTNVSVKDQQPFGFGRFGPPNPNPPVSIIVEYDVPDTPNMTLTLNVPRQDFAAGDKIKVNGSFSDGARQGWGRMGQQVTGSLTLTQAGSNDGDPVAGKFELTISELRGGFMGGRR